MVLPSKLIDGDADRLVDGHRSPGARQAPLMMATNEPVVPSAGARWDPRSPSRTPVVPPCSLRGRSGPTHARRARFAGRGCAWEPSLPSPSLRATVHAPRGRRDEGCLRRGLKVSGWQGGERHHAAGPKSAPGPSSISLGNSMGASALPSSSPPSVNRAEGPPQARRTARRLPKFRAHRAGTPGKRASRTRRQAAPDVHHVQAMTVEIAMVIEGY